MSTSIYCDKQFREYISIWGDSIINLIKIQFIVLIITTTEQLSNIFKIQDLIDIAYLMLFLFSIWLFVRYLRYLVALKQIVKFSKDPTLKNFFLIEIITLLGAILVNFVEFFLNISYNSWIIHYTISLPIFILSLISVLLLSKWQKNLFEEDIEPDLFEAMKKGINLLFIGAILNFIPQFDNILIIVSFFSALLSILGFWKFGKALIIEFGGGELDRIYDTPTPEMYEGL
ncbi:MAG: hypothetical protein K9W44_10590 [Candidatus Lokiarchaeota archaeon]|nr:hypothetical protein [Candidatus Harpocratesius repetitus]